MTPCLQIESLTKSFGDLVLFENFSLGIGEGQRVGLIAKNGTGKTTLLNILAGEEDYDSGTITFRRDLKVAYLEQDPKFPAGTTVLEACFLSDSPVIRAIADYERAVQRSGLQNDDDHTLQEAIAQMDRLDAWTYESRVKQILTRLNITAFDQQTENLSGGQTKRIALANALITEPDLLILDEPTNHLDLEMTRWLEEYLSRTKLTLLMVTHDRYFLDRVCTEIIEIDHRQSYSYKGNYSYYLEKRQERLDAAEAQRESDRNLYRKELDWMRRQPQARATKARARIESFYELEERLRKERETGDVRLDVKASYIGKKIFEVRGLSKRFGEKVILDNFEYTFSRYEKMGIVGGNGTGKSTFIKMLMGEVAPDSGHFDVGETVRFGYYSQDGLKFDEQMKVIDVVQAIAEYVDLGNGQKMGVSQFLNYFLFTPEKQHSYVYKLSGGEKRRLYLCTVLMRSPNFLVLDEPTNDLDIVTLNVLEEYLRNFKGCAIVVSHDRYFINQTATRILDLTNQAIVNYIGDYDYYLEKKEELTEKYAPAAAQAVTEAKQASDNKLSWQQQKEEQARQRKRENELKKVEARIEELETRDKEIDETMILPDICTNVAECAKLSKEKAAITEELEGLYEKWEELA